MQTKNSSWRPTASMETLKARAVLNKKIRAFFDVRDVLEVETPILSEFATVDPHIDSLSTELLGKTHYLQTSPEFFLKRLLSAGFGDVYSLGKVFRQGEKGGRHNPEFTMLEWYRLNWDEHLLAQEVVELLETCAGQPLNVTNISYRQLFLDYLGINPHTVSLAELQSVVSNTIQGELDLSDKTTCLDLLMSHCIEPKLPDHVVIVYDYPAAQSALAKTGLNVFEEPIAHRFEIYWQNMELANGYWELTDANEQKRRFESDLFYRQRNNLPELPYDQNLVSALEAGFPNCAGVALGVDRLLMLLQNVDNVSEVLAFGQ